MPIHRNRSYPTIATVHCGGRKPERGPGRNLDYFRIEPADVENMTEDEIEAQCQSIRSVFGEEPTEIRFLGVIGGYREWYEEHNSAGLVRRCDLQTISRERDDDFNLEHVELPCKREGDDGCKCKPQGYLTMHIPELEQAMGRLGYVLAFIGGFHGTRNAFEATELVKRRYGSLLNVPMVLSRKKTTVETKIEGKTKHITQPIVFLEVTPEFIRNTPPPIPDPVTGELPMPEDETNYEYPWIDELMKITNWKGERLHDWLAETGVSTSVEAFDALVEAGVVFYTNRVQMKVATSGQRLLILHFGELFSVTLNSRQPFVNANVITQADWATPGDYDVHPRIGMTFRQESDQFTPLFIAREGDELPYN